MHWNDGLTATRTANNYMGAALSDLLAAQPASHTQYLTAIHKCLSY